MPATKRLSTAISYRCVSGQKISEKPLHIVLIAIPIIIQCVLNFFIAYYTGYTMCIEHRRLAPAAMIATR